MFLLSYSSMVPLYPEYVSTMDFVGLYGTCFTSNL